MYCARAHTHTHTHAHAAHTTHTHTYAHTHTHTPHTDPDMILRKDPSCSTWLRIMFKRLIMYEADHGMYDDDVS